MNIVHEMNRDIEQTFDDLRTDMTLAGVAHEHLSNTQLYAVICQAYRVLQASKGDAQSWAAWQRAMETVERGEGV